MLRNLKKVAADRYRQARILPQRTGAKASMRQMRQLNRDLNAQPVEMRMLPPTSTATPTIRRLNEAAQKLTAELSPEEILTQAGYIPAEVGINIQMRPESMGICSGA